MNTDTFQHRIKMCDGVREGTEIEDIVKTRTCAARMLYAFEDFDNQIVLVIAERLCSNYIRETILSRQCDWEEYTECCTDEVFSHFSGGAKRVSKEIFDKLTEGN